MPSWAYGNSGTRFKVFGSPGHAARPWRRRSPTPRRCTGSPGWRRPSRCTSRGTRSTTTPRWPLRRRTSGSRLGTINTNTFQDDDYKLGSAHPRRPGGAAQGDRPPPRVHRDHGRDRLPGPEDLVRRRHATTRARTTSAPARTGWPRRCARSTPGSARTSGWCWSTSSSSRRSTTPTCPTGARRTRTARPSASGRMVVPGHRPPRARHEHRVHRRPAAAAREARLVRLQLAGSTPTTT